MHRKLLPFVAGLLAVWAGFSAAQESTSITVTNNNIALVKEKRTLDLKKGTQSFNLVDIPAQIVPTSVLVESDAFTVLEQNFEYDLINVDKILQKSLEKEIVIEHPEQGKINGTLLSANSSSMIIRTKDGVLQVVPRNNEQKISLLGLGTGEQPFIIRPTLVWQIDAEKDSKTSAQISYLTKGLTWQADYVALLDEKDTGVVLSGWVTINNTSGKTFKDSKLKLLAGDINLVKDSSRPQPQYEVMAMAKSAPSFQEKSFFEYHLYNLERTTTIADNQTKQIQLFGDASAKVTKSYQVTSNNPGDVSVVISLKNSKENNLGMPLPEGTIRLYKKDGDEREFVGENRIEHTPKDEKIDIPVGNAFDIVAERNVLETKRPEKRVERHKVEYIIRNHKEEAVTVEVLENVPQYAEITLISSSVPLAEKKAEYLKFKPQVKADEEFVLTLEYSIRW